MGVTGKRFFDGFGGRAMENNFGLGSVGMDGRLSLLLSRCRAVFGLLSKWTGMQVF